MRADDPRLNGMPAAPYVLFLRFVRIYYNKEKKRP